MAAWRLLYTTETSEAALNRTVKKSLYNLKKHFQVKVVLHTRVVEGVVNDFTGVQTVSSKSRSINAILLPVSFKTQEQLDRGASSRYAGDLQVGDREFIIDQKYGISEGDYIVYQGKRFDVIALADYEGLAYFALVRNTQNEPSA